MARLALVLLACMAVARPAFAAAPVILAPASLQNVMDMLADRWAAEGHERPVISAAGSQAVARQAAAGAPADVILTADREWMDWLSTRGVLATKPTVVAGNRLVLVAPEGTPWIGSGPLLMRALGNGRLALADPDVVPAGRYARAALTRLGVWSQLEGRLARAENVRAALAFVERGAAPVGIVYATDARASNQVKVAGRFATTAHPPIVYPAALLAQSSSDQALPFLNFLRSEAARAIFRRSGFTTS